MNIRTASLGFVLMLGTAAIAQTPESATQRAAQRVQQLVEPPSKPALYGSPTHWRGAAVVEQPQLPPGQYTGLPPQPPVAQPAKPPLPRPAPEGQPPAGQGPMPKGVPLPTRPVIQLPAVDVNKPLPIPILGQPKQDRAAIDDVTLEASQAAALTHVRPRRMGRAPFAPINLPDPFANQRSGGLHNPLAESDQPPPVPIRTPR